MEPTRKIYFQIPKYRDLLISGYSRELSNTDTIVTELIGEIDNFCGEKEIKWDPNANYIGKTDTNKIQIGTQGYSSRIALVDAIISSKMCKRFDIEFSIQSYQANKCWWRIGYVESKDHITRWSDKLGARSTGKSVGIYLNVLWPEENVVGASKTWQLRYDVDRGKEIQNTLFYPIVPKKSKRKNKTNDENVLSMDLSKHLNGSTDKILIKLLFDFVNDKVDVYVNGQSCENCIPLEGKKAIIPAVSMWMKGTIIEIGEFNFYH